MLIDSHRSRANLFSFTLLLALFVVVLGPVSFADATAGSPDAALATVQPYAGLLEAAYPADGPGATALVARDGEVVFRGARGMADLELGVSLLPEHVFRLGSITKQFTAAAILLLAERGELSLDDEITKFLPEYPTHGHRITVEHLLQHTSGISSYTSIPGYMTGPEIRADLTTDELVDVFDHLPMDFAPGARWQYNNSGYVLLGAILEKVSGVSYAEFVEENLFTPLGMEHSHYGGPQIVPGRVAGYAGDDDDGYVNAPFLSMTQPHAAGSLLSNVDDMARWNEALFGGEVLRPESLERMTRKTVLNDGETADYGYGLQVGTFLDQAAITHGGGIHGFRTDGIWLPESKLYVVVLSNIAGGDATPPGHLARRLAAASLGEEWSPPPPAEKPDEIQVDPATWEHWVGTYEIQPGFELEIRREGDRLISQATNQPPFEIHPSSRTRYFVKEFAAELEFVQGDDGGRAVALILYQGGQEIRAERIE